MPPGCGVSRKIERATYEAVPFRFIAGNLHPDHDTLAAFRRTFLPELKELFVQVLLLAKAGGGTKARHDQPGRDQGACRCPPFGKRSVTSGWGSWKPNYKPRSRSCLRLCEQSEQPEVADGLVVSKEIARRQDRLARLAEAKAVLEARAQERMAAEQAEYEAKLAQREERERTTGRSRGGCPPTPPTPGPGDGDQYNFTDPESRIMKNPTNAGFEQDYNTQIAVDQKSLLIVGYALSNHPNDSQEAEPTLAAIPSTIGTPEAAALDAGYFGPATRASCGKRGIEPYIATGRDPHHPELAAALRPAARSPT